VKKLLTLVIISKKDRILLGMKKRGFGEGLWNGFGGKVDVGETIEGAARRELEEEAGLTTGELSLAGILNFTFASEANELEVYTFKIDDFVGEPIETEEMRAKWFTHAEIPFADMWADDAYWLPLLLSEALFKGHFHFDAPSTTERRAKIISYDLVEVNNLDESITKVRA
jgi:8-oxo-dGTP diphosphatase/2-hydroxy-dATP diphosphatase